MTTPEFVDADPRPWEQPGAVRRDREPHRGGLLLAAAQHSARAYRAERPCDLLRCVFGNPFRPVTFDPAWRTAEVLRLAEAIYAERAFDRLPILADLLEEAGATDAALLAHLRGPGPHALGCHALDAILGKE